MKSKLLLIAIVYLTIVSDSIAQTIWPVHNQNSQAEITGTIGEMRGGGSRFHRGVDIINTTAGANSTNVYATVSGTANLVPGSFGDQHIQVGDVYYYHINFNVDNGQQVNVGDLIGTMRTDGPIHVHYQRNDRNYLNGHLSPFVDQTVPTIHECRLYADGLTRTNTTNQFQNELLISSETYTQSTIRPIYTLGFLTLG